MLVPITQLVGSRRVIIFMGTHLSEQQGQCGARFLGCRGVLPPGVKGLLALLGPPVDEA